MIHVSYVKFAQNDINESIETQALKRKHDLSKHVSSIEGTFRIHPERSHVPGWRKKLIPKTKKTKQKKVRKSHRSEALIHGGLDVGFQLLCIDHLGNI